MSHDSVQYDAIRAGLGQRTVVLIGMMGAGKTSVGRRLAMRLGLGFVDADKEIELAAGMSIPDIFQNHGEAAFRDGERRVIARLIAENGPRILATGGGAFINPETRALIRQTSISVWLKADFDVLMQRVRRKATRPLLKTANPEETMRTLLQERNPVYAQADITVHTGAGPHQKVVKAITDALRAHFEDGEPQ